jgi:hypothetical protein
MWSEVGVVICIAGLALRGHARVGAATGATGFDLMLHWCGAFGCLRVICAAQCCPPCADTLLMLCVRFFWGGGLQQQRQDVAA